MISEEENGVVGAKGTEAEREVNKRRFARLTYDYAFKVVFGSEGREKLLLALLNRIIPGVGLVELQFLPTEKVVPNVSEYKSAFDVYCKDSSGRRVLIEMQIGRQRYFNKRAMFYCSYGIQDQAKDAIEEKKKKGERWDYNYNPVYIVGFLNYKSKYIDRIEGDLMPYITTYHMRSDKSNRLLEDGANVIMIDLEGFTKEYGECMNMLEKWLYSIKNIHTLEEAPEDVKGSELDDLYKSADLMNWDDNNLTTYNTMTSKAITEFDMLLQEERIISREEGIEEGIESERNRIRELINQGYSAEQLLSVLCEPNEEYQTKHKELNKG